MCHGTKLTLITFLGLYYKTALCNLRHISWCWVTHVLRRLNVGFCSWWIYLWFLNTLRWRICWRKMSLREVWQQMKKWCCTPHTTTRVLLLTSILTCQPWSTMPSQSSSKALMWQKACIHPYYFGAWLNSDFLQVLF